MDQQRVEKYSSGGEEASNVQQSSGTVVRRAAWQRKSCEGRGGALYSKGMAK
jgi:hypothetical protein